MVGKLISCFAKFCHARWGCLQLSTLSALPRGEVGTGIKSSIWLKLKLILKPVTFAMQLQNASVWYLVVKVVWLVMELVTERGSATFSSLPSAAVALTRPFSSVPFYIRFRSLPKPPVSRTWAKAGPLALRRSRRFLTLGCRLLTWFIYWKKTSILRVPPFIFENFYAHAFSDHSSSFIT